MSQFRLTIPKFNFSPEVRGLVISALVWSCGCHAEVPVVPPIMQARVALIDGDYKKAKALTVAIAKDDPTWSEAQVVLGKVASANRYLAAGLPYFESIPRDGSEASLEASRLMGEIHIKLGSLQKAGECYDYVLKEFPADVAIHSLKADLMTKTGQRSQAEQHLLEVTKLDRIAMKDLVILTAPDRTSASQYLFLKLCAQRQPHDPFVNLGLAVEERADQKPLEARQRLIEIVKSFPEFADAQALLGELTLDVGLPELQTWHSQLPSSLKSHPGVWYVRGLWSRQLKENRVAARCFWETIRQIPHHRRAMYQLGQVMAPLDPRMSSAFIQRAEDLKKYSELMERIMIQSGRDEQMFQDMVALLKGMGREWEARGWAKVGTEMLGHEGWPGAMLASFDDLDPKEDPRFQPDRDLARLYDLSQYPDFDSLNLGVGAESASSPPTASHIHFVDQAAELGVEFTYFHSPDTRTKGVRIFESTGGGMGVIDYDLDGRPDLYMTQGETWNPGEDRPVPSDVYRDRLYRQSVTGFQDVSEMAGLAVEDGYGQGCSGGDFNNDGFVDLYVANIGANQLLLNNGDGTFSDVTLESGIHGQAWTTSCLIMDLNADGNPDLYDVNYLQGEAMFRIECGANRCSVRDYSGAPDQVMLSRGDGTFVVVPDATPTENSKGLGIVALFLDRETKPSLFIANDQVPNYFLRPTAVDGQYLDQAMLSGLAVNMEGQPTACMGVASGDLNHDRLTDLFVTNFEGEANNLYLQRGNGFFEDAIRGTELMAAGIPYVGWGTQFLDADNDRELDIVVSNGHIADFGEPGVQYQMPTQFFRNLGQGRFQQLLAADVGPHFDRFILGRSLAILDWNQDHKLDFIQSAIAAPVIISTNQTEDAGHAIGIRLHARTTARDALGTLVEVRQGDSVRWQQLLAGDGYQVTNERQLHFGLGRHDIAATVVVHWPSGTLSTFESVPVDTTLEVVEGLPQATLWRGMEPMPLQ